MIARDFRSAAAEDYDLIVVGGGVYGICLTLEAARQGLRPLLLERGDFGCRTSWNSLRIVHGGLRYLQQLGLRRFRQSVGERAWFLTHFPDLVQPLECLMPLYGKGLRRPSVFRLALAANEVLSWGRARDTSGERLLRPGRVISSRETLEMFPIAAKDDLVGGAVWFDAVMPLPQRLLIEMIHWATACGATVLNYVEATAMPEQERRHLGVAVVDRTDGEESLVHAPVVVNTSGPWCRDVAQRLDRDIADIHQVAVGFNVLLDIPGLSTSAAAVESKRPNGGTYFLVPADGRVLAGTFHSAWTGTLEDGRVLDEWLDEFLSDLSLALPAAGIDRQRVERVDWGFLPTDQSGSAVQARRPVIAHHGEEGGVEGLFSVSGVKFTTARLVAETTLRRVLAYLGRSWSENPGRARPTAASCMPREDLIEALQTDRESVAGEARRLATEECVVRLDDLMMRRTDWAADPSSAVELGRQIAPLLGWDAERVSAETRRIAEITRRYWT